MTNLILTVLDWALAHQPTIVALLTVALIAYVVGMYHQFVEDDKKAAGAGTPNGRIN